MVNRYSTIDLTMPLYIVPPASYYTFSDISIVTNKQTYEDELSRKLIVVIKKFDNFLVKRIENKNKVLDSFNQALQKF